MLFWAAATTSFEGCLIDAIGPKSVCSTALHLFNMKILVASLSVVAMSLAAPTAAFADDVTLYELTVNGINWKTKIKNIEKGPFATLILRKNESTNVCKELYSALPIFEACSAKAAGDAYTKQAVNAITKALK